MDGLSISNVSIDITATRERNMTRIECSDVTMDSSAFSVASLTVRGMWYIACMCHYSAGFCNYIPFCRRARETGGKV